MSSKSSIDGNLLSTITTPQNFKLTRNVPLDCRFIVSSLNKIDTELPLAYRYNGLIFFVADKTVQLSGKTITGILYTFESDLTKPVPLHDTILRFVVSSMGDFNGNWSNLNQTLDNSNAKEGSIVYISDLGIAVVRTGSEWKYLAGNYTIPSVDAWSTIPDNLKTPNTVVYANNVKKIVLSDKTLSDEIIVTNSIPSNPEHNRYYNINGFLHHSIGGALYGIGVKTVIHTNVRIDIGDNMFQHNFDSKFVNASVITEYNGYPVVIPAKISIKDSNSIYIKSSVTINNAHVLISSTGNALI